MSLFQSLAGGKRLILKSFGCARLREFLFLKRVRQNFARFVGFALTGPEAGIKPVLGKEFGVPALFNDHSLIENNNVVRMDDSGEPMRNH